MDIYSVDTLRARLASPILLAAIMGDYTAVRALRLALSVSENCPALFPEFATALADRPFSRDAIRAACWDLMHLASDVTGAYDVFAEARAIAAA